MPRIRIHRVAQLTLLVPVAVTIFLAVKLHYEDVPGYPGALVDMSFPTIGDPNAVTDPEKQRSLEILLKAGYDIENKTLFSKETLASLPRLSDVTSFYGPPKVLGLETCDEYKRTVSPHNRIMAVAGMFNSGTNMLHRVLFSNCRNDVGNVTGRGITWQVPWGKHNPPSERGRRKASKFGKIEHDNVLPVVAVRDPMTWMQSMCRHNYQAQFDHNKETCPNLHPYEEDIRVHPRYGKMKYMPVFVTYSSDLKRKYESLAHLWNEWYSEYLNVTFPRLVVRLEDMVFRANEVLPIVCDCYGGKWEEEVSLHADVANRNHGVEVGVENGLIRSVIQYGNTTNRRKGYPPNQLEAAKEALDDELMNLLGYKFEEP